MSALLHLRKWLGISKSTQNSSTWHSKGPTRRRLVLSYAQAGPHAGDGPADLVTRPRTETSVLMVGISRGTGNSDPS